MATAPYDTLITVMNTVRVRIGDDLDTLLPVGGQIGSNSQAYSQQIVNTAWRKVQEFLVSKGCVLLQPPPVTISGFGAMPSAQPGVETYVSWSEYFDGTNHNAGPVLPQDLIEPIQVEESLSSAFIFNKMDLIIGAMPAVPQTAWNGSWQWRQNKLVMPGTTQSFALRVSYNAYYGDFLDTGDVTSATGFVPWFEQTVPIMRSLDAFANYICAEIERARENMQGVLGYTTDAENSATMIIDKDFMRQKGIAKASEFGKMRDQYTPGNAPQIAPPQ